MKQLFFPALLTLFVCLFSATHLPAQTRGWGYNLNGALGAGNLSNQPAPQTIAAALPPIQ